MLENLHLMCDVSFHNDVDIQGASRRLAWGFTGLVVLTSSLIVLGALVRVHEAGLACPDWPLCFGQLIPQMNLQVGFEWTHRVLAGTVAIIFATLIGLTWRQPSIRKSLCLPILSASILLLVQILLGALTVWELLAPWTVTSHLMVGNAFNASLAICALRLSRTGDVATPSVDPPVRIALLAFGSLLAIQIALGGLVASNYAGLACSTWPTCDGDSMIPSISGPIGIHLLHRWNAILLTVVAGLATWSTRKTHLFPLVGLGMLLCCVETLIGIANVLFAIPVELTTLHSAVAAGLVLCFSIAIHDAFS